HPQAKTGGCMTAVLAIEIDPAVLAEVEQLLLALEHAPECVRQRLANSFRSLLSGLCDGDLTFAPVAGQNILRLEFPAGWLSELRAAAACANQIDSFCAHGGPHEK
ncbi:hypothetical protein ACFIQG_21270, partial [Comamonas odontotermitis]|uniref:hypothetical protein n=1 Tax=Comamonas odontotermitis TaxID=379895 RepID=UPI00366C982B